MTDTPSPTTDAPRRATHPHRPGRITRRFGRFIGALLIAAGLVLFADIAWQLWGTGIATATQQHRLGHQFQADTRQVTPTHPAAAARTTTPPTAAVDTATRPAATAAAADTLPAPPSTQPTPAPGSLVGHLVIPKIGVNNYVVEGVGASQLAEGTGHYPGTAPIGGNGNVGIAGHRTTHGAPFYSLNKLHPGDLIYLTNTSGQTFTYQVTSQLIVAPNDTAVLNPTPTRTLTLTTCNPIYSATQRLIVHATLVA